MSTDIDPCRDSRQLENETYALNDSGKTVVRVTDDDAISVLNQILGELGGTAGVSFHESFEGATTPNTTQTVISRTVAASKTDSVMRVQVSCRQRVVYKILVNTSVIGSGRTGPGESNSIFLFTPSFNVSAGDTIKVEVLQTIGPASDVEVYLMGTEN